MDVSKRCEDWHQYLLNFFKKLFIFGLLVHSPCVNMPNKKKKRSNHCLHRRPWGMKRLTGCNITRNTGGAFRSADSSPWSAGLRSRAGDEGSRSTVNNGSLAGARACSSQAESSTPRAVAGPRPRLTSLRILQTVLHAVLCRYVLAPNSTDPPLYVLSCRGRDHR